MAGKVVKLEIGTVYQKTAKGCYYFRYQINGQRKAVSMKTRNQKEAIKKAQELVPVVKSTTTEMIFAHVKHARGLAKREKSLPLKSAWEIYSKHPDKATPATVREQGAYRSTWDEFVEFAGSALKISSITPEVADNFAQQLRGNDLAVDTHNRKIRRI
jgi:hypothetical protein